MLERFRTSITYPIVASLVLLTLVPVCLVGWTLARRNREQITNRELQYLNREARALGSTFETYFGQRRTALESTAVALGISGRVDEAAVAPLLTSLIQRDRSFLRVQLYDSQGTAATGVSLGRYSDELSAALTAGTDSTTAAIGDGTEAYRLERILPGVDGGALYIAIPIASPDGRRLGSLAAAVSMQAITSILEDPAYLEYEIGVVDAAGQRLLGSSATADSPDFSDNPLIADFRRFVGSSRQGSTARLSLNRRYERDGTELIGSISDLTWPVWGVLVERSSKEVLRPVTRMIRDTAVVSLVASILALLVGLVLSRRLTRPIQLLAEVSTKLSHGDLSVRSEIHGHDELAQLADNFNIMAESVEDLVKRLKAALKKNQELFLDTIRAVAASIDAKDPYTRGHSQRVSQYSTTIAKYMEMSPDQCFRIRIAGILHDVGKVGIKDSILNKPGRLTDEEFGIMKQHTVIGYQIMKPIPSLRDLLPGIRSHHEAWNGSGYPDGLSGEDIPLMARIIGCADTFDAMTTTRPYQKAMTTDFVVSKMRDMAEKRFDPRVMNAFLKAIAAGDIIPPKDRRSQEPS